MSPRLRRFLLLVSVSWTLAAARSTQGTVRIVDDSVADFGAVFTLDLGATYALDTHAEWSERAATLPEVTHDGAGFGGALAALGDLDGNGAVDLAVGAPGHSFGGPSHGAVWIVHRGTDGSLDAQHVIRPGTHGFVGPLASGNRFGESLASLGDLDGNGVADLAVGAPGGIGRLWVLFLAADGSVASEVLIGSGSGGFGGALSSGDGFGTALAALGDLDGNGVSDLAVGAPGDDDGAPDSGAVWILYLDHDGTVLSQRKLSTTFGGFSGVSVGEGLGSSLAALTDLDGNGATDLVVGASRSDDGSPDQGAVWILFLRLNQTVLTQQKLSETAGGLGNVGPRNFGASVAALGDLDGNGAEDIVVGAAGSGFGVAYVLRLTSSGTVLARSDLGTGLGLDSLDGFGASLASLGDLDGDGRPDLVVGAPGRNGASGFTSLPTAIATAAEGDVLLLRWGSYSGLDIGAKSLTVQPESDSVVVVSGEPVRIHGLGAGQRVFLRDLRLGRLELINNCGLVWIEGCEVPGELRDPPRPGLSIDACGNVVLIDSRLAAATPWIQEPAECEAQPGVSILGPSTMHAYDCTFVGGDGWPECQAGSSPQRGGAGLRSSGGSFVFLSGCTATGGAGGDDVLACADGGTGASGVSFTLDCTLVGGAGGAGCPDGPSSTGNPTPLRGPSASLVVPSPIREGDGFEISFRGPPHALVHLEIGLESAPRFRLALSGTALVEPLVSEFLGVTDAQGRLDVQRTATTLPDFLPALRIYFQARFAQSTSPLAPGTARATRPRLGAGTVSVLLDDTP